MSKDNAKKIVKKYADQLKKEHYPFSEIYLFGSYAQNKAHEWSDIDVAVVSNKLLNNVDKNRFLLWKLRMGISTKIEPHGFTPADFKNNTDPMVYEIKKTGIKIA